ncbi:uncharacterized protein LOC126647510 [Myiozetetes cayanensis]|uniref:uncharacterized protein LOC126647510 n=1 Tax=Myiozetetes cayanensis TaxID=478635 RepID=UPI00215F9C4D|nr:uncharacterized protein LOC126647510 [Myiozetetes cayanensis]
MASGREWSCPICCNALDNVAYSMPCRHQFCLGCIMRWLRGNRACPLCRRPISTISFSEQEGNCLHCVTRLSREPPEASSSQAGSVNTHGPGQGPAGPEAVGGILPELWAELFRRRWTLLDPVRSWLQQRLEKIYRDKWWQVKTAESSVLLALCIFGPNRDGLVQRLQPRLQEHTAPLIHGILSIIETQCSQEVWRLRHSHAAREEDESPGDSSVFQGCAPTSSGPPHSRVEEVASMSEDALQGSPIWPPSAPVPAEWEQP